MAGGEENGKAVGRGRGGDEAGLPKPLQGKIYYGSTWNQLVGLEEQGRGYIYGIVCVCWSRVKVQIVLLFRVPSVMVPLYLFKIHLKFVKKLIGHP